MTLFRHYGRNTAFKKRSGKTRTAFENFGPRPARRAWPQARIDALCDMVADGLTFGEAAEKLGVSRSAASGYFSRIRQSFGWQGQ
jgi:hypothetical protein